MTEDGTFHDTPHLAITRLAKKLGVLDLARMVGHRDLRQLQVYYNVTAAAMAARLDWPGPAPGQEARRLRDLDMPRRFR
jgi:integrase